MDDSKTLDSLVDNLLKAMPVIHKRIMKISPPNVNCGIHISRVHFGVLAALYHRQSPVTEIANVFLISKPQMTFIINQMLEAGLITRSTNPRDRRIKDTVLTPKGEDVFRQCDKYIKHHVKNMFSGLTEKELGELSESLRKLQEIGLRQEPPGKSAPPLPEFLKHINN